MKTDPRYIALSVLDSWHRNQFTLDSSLKKHEKAMAGLALNDRNLCNAMIFGVLRHRKFIDYTIRAFSNIPVEKMDIKVLYILRIGIFQIQHMNRVPDFAAVDTAVETAKYHCGKKAANFINAVLRKAACNWRNLNLPDRSKQKKKFVSVKYSLPLWLAEKWINAFGFNQTCALCEQINTIPPITIRTNTLKTDRNSLAQELSAHVSETGFTDYSSWGIKIRGPAVPVHELDAFRKGQFQVQDEAAQLVTALLDPEPEERILDTCAGNGGKTCHIAQIMKNQGSITALDIKADKLASLESEAARLGIDIIETKACDILRTGIKDFPSYFDRVLVDAPCTGLGVLRRNPDTKWKRTKNDIARLAASQKKILNAASNLVRPGGILVYAVCSCEKEENENVIMHFLKKRRDFSIDEKPPAAMANSRGFLKTYPSLPDMDGFFACRMIRKPELKNLCH
jgi:16S rRNA (cytosine967-C5)-methyltransferase